MCVKGTVNINVSLGGGGGLVFYWEGRGSFFRAGGYFWAKIPKEPCRCGRIPGLIKAVFESAIGSESETLLL
jgi:hypothetical protein